MRFLPLFLLPALLLSACSTPTPPAAPDPQKELRGTVTDWKGGASTVTLLVGDQSLASTPLSVGGTFALTLPPSAALAGLGVKASSYPAFSAGCTRDLQVSAPDASLVVVSSLQVKTASGTQTISRFERSYDSVLDASNSAQDVLVYASADTQIYGEVSCSDASKRASYNVLLRLNAGWNTVRLTQSILPSPAITRAVTQFVSVPITVDSIWKVGSLQALSR
ncbi:hypothetical protein EHF33_06275 [Deinococcus psychrotolerans]|uniref:Lipoprotein n=1 Tax=Deinococcus psychrotolerans TaxID=2489213 RepID=A0A3G8YMN3_9DEIO|nr:hypothetical protein [Deinococcus psychrotolerans]AZI42406.1 hypothetical protein EHF33_06275 [Deinococcus psychrotolerans]